MTIFILTFAFLLIVVAGMAVGVISSNKPIKGSCGGIQALGLGGECEICGGNPDKCEEESGSQLANPTAYSNDTEQVKPAYYDASKPD